nr:hypothetical protein [Tanacetum cinerariifolium]
MRRHSPFVHSNSRHTLTTYNTTTAGTTTPKPLSSPRQPSYHHHISRTTSRGSSANRNHPPPLSHYGCIGLVINPKKGAYGYRINQTGTFGLAVKTAGVRLDGSHPQG